MSVGNDDTVDTLVAFVSGALLGAAATLLYVRVQRNRMVESRADDDDYYYDGGSFFI